VTVHRLIPKQAAGKPEPAAEEPLYSIRTLAAELNITTRAIRFYEAKGLIKPRRIRSQRLFTGADRARLLLILRGKRLGFSLAEVSDYLDLYDADPGQVEQMKLLLTLVRDRIGLLEAQRRDIDQTLDELKTIANDVVAALTRMNATTSL
jgi:DNA-binding transcriptional MerR regulator